MNIVLILHNVKVVCASKINVKQNHHPVFSNLMVNVAVHTILPALIIVMRITFAKKDHVVDITFVGRSTTSSTEKEENSVLLMDLWITNVKRDMSAKIGYAVNSSRHVKYHTIMIVLRVYATKITIVYRIIVTLLLVKLMLAELLGMNQEEQMENGVMMCLIGRLLNVQATFVNTGNVNHRMYPWVKCV